MKEPIILEGKLASANVKQELAEQVKDRLAQGFRPPHLCAILVGDVVASHTYVNAKTKACAETGFESSVVRLPETITEEELMAEIDAINANDSIDGLIVQLPLPKGISENAVIERIDPKKDVDGFHPVNIGRMAKGLEAYLPATPAGILELLKQNEIETSGKHCVVIGRSNIVGSPISILMSQNAYPGNSTVTLCHSKTVNLRAFTQSADIIIVALGKPHFLKADDIKEGVAIIDVGINSLPDETKKSGYRLVGDVDYEDVISKVSAITPVPGGVGPMTIALLMRNTLQAAMKNPQPIRA
jgi:methylenetetrahydrofolate dehydrogenase (NADP+)/methenyltetrahydrofolate cyclohydrolase